MPHLAGACFTLLGFWLCHSLIFKEFAALLIIRCGRGLNWHTRQVILKLTLGDGLEILLLISFLFIVVEGEILSFVSLTGKNPRLLFRLGSCINLADRVERLMLFNVLHEVRVDIAIDSFNCQLFWHIALDPR